MMKWRSAFLGGAAMVFAALGAAAAQAASIDWASVPGKPVTLFYPGQTSWESRIAPAIHPGAGKFNGGKNCFACHNGDEKGYGALLVSGKKNEPTPIAGKPGSIVATVKFAEDAQNLYVHLEFKEGAQPDAKMDPKYPTKVTMMLIDSSVAEGMRAGCWASCHEDSATMPSAKGAGRTLYVKSGSMEYWQARLNPGHPAEAINGSVSDKRAETQPTQVSADANFAGGGWSVTLSRKLDAGAGFKKLAAGKPYMVGFAIHSGHTARRFHYVSFEHTLALGQGAADFVAVKK